MGGAPGNIYTGLSTYPSNRVVLGFEGEEVVGANKEVASIGTELDPNVALKVDGSPGTFTNTDGLQESRGAVFTVTPASACQTVNVIKAYGDFTGTNVQSSIAADAEPIIVSTVGAGQQTAIGFGNLATFTSGLAAAKNYGFYGNYDLNVNQATTNQNYNFYAAGSAPNYFRGSISCSGTLGADLPDVNTELIEGTYLTPYGQFVSTANGGSDALANLLIQTSSTNPTRTLAIFYREVHPVLEELLLDVLHTMVQTPLMLKLQITG